MNKLIASTVFALCVATVNATPAAAQLTQLGATNAASGHISVIHGLAYSARHDVYLTVFEGPDGIRGRFVNAAGVAVGGVFSVAALGQQAILYANKPMVAYSHDSDDDVFFVMYATDFGKFPDAQPSAYIQRVRFNGSGGERVGTPILAGAGAWEIPNDLVFNPVTRQFVAVWERFFSEGPDVMARFFNVDGTAATGIINVTSANHGQGAAKAAVDWERNRILIAYQGLHPNSPVLPEILGMWAKVIDGSSGALLTDLITVHPGFTIEAVPVFLPERDGFVVGWTGFNPGRDVLGRFVSTAADSLGSMPSPAFVIAGSSRSEGASMGVYDATSRRVLMGIQSSGGCPNDGCPNLDGALLDGQGVALGSFTGLSTAGALPSYYPDVVVGEGGHFGVSYSLNYSSVWVERVSLAAASVPGPVFGGGGGGNPAGSLTLSPSSLRFVATKSGSTLTASSPPQSVVVGFSGDAVGGAWSAASSVSWLQVSNGSGTGAGQFTVTLTNPGDVIGGQTSLSGTVVITAAGAANSPLALNVSLAVLSSSTTQNPMGAFDTPVHNSTVSGTIAVTGWALDDVGIDRVEIWRDVVGGDPATPFNSPGHPGHGKVFVGHGAFVEGTRPDVEALYGSTPLKHRAGWGYLLLTWGFPNANGNFVLTAVAWDKEGKSTVLGTKSIAVNNSTATKPFGSIDVPAYGSTFSGHQFTFGWVLTPNAGCTMSGGQLYMSIDSAPPNFPVTYGANRTDIAAAFPGFTDSNGAGGAVALNSTQFTNGTHAIGWLAYDSCGNGEGIGSRFFKILNGAADLKAAADDGTVARQGPAFAQVGTALTDVAAGRSDGLWLVRGIGVPAIPVEKGATIWLGQTGRIEVHATAPGEWADPRTTYAGYLELNGTLHPLPVGSSFDTARGIFHWQPVAGFLGRFPLRIVRLSDGQPVDAWTVPVVVSADAHEPAMQIDSPTWGQQVPGQFVMTGWVLDPASAAGSGIGAVHVWATRVGADGRALATPIFLGDATLGQSRADVGNHFGRQFDASGFSLTTAALTPGDYDVVAYGWNQRTGQWAVARLVKVSIR